MSAEPDDAKAPAFTQPDGRTIDPDAAFITEQIVETTVRRVPKYSVFCGLGAVIGVLIALILSSISFSNGDESTANEIVFSQAQVFGFLAIAGIAIGVIVGGLIALIFERTIGRRTRVVQVDLETVRLSEKG